MSDKLGLSQEKIKYARTLALEIVTPVQEYIKNYTTATIERTTLRLLGTDGINAESIPVPNLIVDQLIAQKKLNEGAAKYYLNALVKENQSPQQLNQMIAQGYSITSQAFVDKALLQAKANELIGLMDQKISGNVKHRQQKLEQFRDKQKSPMLYVIVATGNIYEDVKQAQAAALQGADVIAVIRTTAQSLLDYVPYGPTTEGFGGTYATQENFKIMRAAIDEIIEKEQRYIRVVNYCSGLCMPEIAAMGALERLDMMLNDSMYGILFRDINMYRTFVDQNFSRMINAYAEIIINTGEDNYLTTSDAVEKAFTVLASQLINEQFAYKAGMKPELVGLGHAFEMDPTTKNGFLMELAQAQMAREIFPHCPLKYMPPTKYMTGQVFRGYAMNTLFNFVSKATHQSIHLLGMLTEAIHTPYMQDRFLAIDNALYVMNNVENFYEEIEFKKDGFIVARAKQVLDDACVFLEDIKKKDLFNAIEQGMFADVKRARDMGKGGDGVFEKAADYWNPVEIFLNNKLN